MSSHILVSFILFFLSLPLIYLFSSKFLIITNFPFISSPDSDDNYLFRRAATTNPHTTATNPKPKIAFLFLTNSNLSFAPLWEKFFSDDNNRHLFNIYIHADPTSAVADPGGVFHHRFIPSKKTYRSSPTLISASRRLLANALLDDILNQYFALVSQHCIPLFSFRFVYKYLFKDNLTSLTNFSLSNSRYQSFIEILSNEPRIYERYLARGRDVMIPEVHFHQFRVGSQFFVLTRRHAKMVVRDTRLWRKFRLPCITAEQCYPEEHYFPTLLSMEDLAGCTGFMLTRVNWTGCWDGHPHRYEPEEVSPQLIRDLRESNQSSQLYLFARKFSPECLQPLMNIADDVIFRDM
ncbi:hypothetical protein Lal_00028354 [Lupinus albus]|uniref:Putative glycosyl transferase, family 14 n=1 Tax=Lupinus albus TaxID=3870 RepID=A0A6A4NNV9_LUPAL|nr:putative glycosyl transferase, family 14 [Lupinus albus]KAF1884477.1 hypothetical protein Lal_00028354 [Lupinus albus]